MSRKTLFVCVSLVALTMASCHTTDDLSRQQAQKPYRDTPWSSLPLDVVDTSNYKAEKLPAHHFGK